jgi:chemotaxis protein MotB
VKYNNTRARTGNEGWLTSYADLITNLLVFFVLIISASEIQTGKMEKIIESLSHNQSSSTTLTKAAKEVSQSLADQELQKDVSVKLTDSGLEISFSSGVVFASGQAEILPQMESPLAKVLAVVRPYTEKYQVAIEGHTDETPMNSGIFPSNWELSSARAMRIRERLAQAGIDQRKIRIEAYADNKPLPKEQRENLNRETLLAKHRRVVIRLF